MMETITAMTMATGSKAGLSESIQFNAGLLRCFPEVILIPLQCGGKRPAQKFQLAKEKNCLWSIETKTSIMSGWLRFGRNVGLILHHARLWVLDLDAESGWPSSVDDAIARLNPPQVRTPSGGRHCYFALPADLVNHPHLKGHVIHPTIDGVKVPLDLKLGGRQTLVVAAGSQKDSRRYRPLTSWLAPPELDPRSLFPSISVFHEYENQVFDVDTRHLDDRLARAKAYLKRKAPVSVSTKQGNAALMRVCTHLLRYLQISQATVMTLLTTPPGSSWNDRCRDGKTGNPYPWSTEELRVALQSAHTLVPAFGVRQRQIRLAQEGVATQLDLACRVLLRSTDNKGGSAVLVNLIWKTFLQVGAIPPERCTLSRFGTFLGEQGLVRVRKGKRRRWHLMLTITLDELEQQLRETISPQEPQPTIVISLGDGG